MDLPGLTVQARMSNLLEDELVYDRYVFAGPRASDNLLFRENRRREIGRVMESIVKGSFCANEKGGLSQGRPFGCS
ncbi:hypothetical protein [Aurantiacibacter suaedae]|uniref:hypothetical protein n=1 Tax=Aurantiacibacter suaedae TaxID=2545755 RepID=UPI0010F623D8|nr:hypothetical protein [Aurantiacibacter suaedae]